MIPLGMNGKTDDGQILAVTAYLHHTIGIERRRIKKDWYILIDRSSFEIKKIVSHVTNEDMEDNPLVRHPDIIIFEKNSGDIKMVIELDGSFHNTNMGKTKTVKRNQMYNDAFIPFLIIDIPDFKELGLSWFDFLDDHAKELS